MYKIGGSLGYDDPSYIERAADQELYQALKNQEFCYVLNCRQMGKSSLLVRTRHRLEAEGYKCATLDMTSIGSESITPAQWYKGIIAELWAGFNLVDQFNLKKWWQELEEFSSIQKLKIFIAEVLLREFAQEKIVIFIDEIDAILSLPFSVDDFFALIRYCYNQRANQLEYNYLNVAIFGVATPTQLITDKTKTPFNIGTAIPLTGFNLEQLQKLTTGLNIKAEIKELLTSKILFWTGGQPFLTQKLCKIILEYQGSEKSLEAIIKAKIIDNWQYQDEPEHLRTIQARIEHNQNNKGKILAIYQEILEGKDIASDNSREQIELLLSGLVKNQEGFLRVKNGIYQQIFNLEWVNNQFKALRPYSQSLEAWFKSQKTDESRLLRGQALREANIWAQGKNLSNLDYQFLAASEELERQEVQRILEAERAKAIASQLAQQQKTAKLQKLLIIAASIALAVTSGLGIISFSLYRQAEISKKEAKASEIQATIKSAEALLASEQHLEALMAGIDAEAKLSALDDIPPLTTIYLEKILWRILYNLVEFNRLSGHQSTVWDLDFSPDGQTLVSGSGDRTIKLWDLKGNLLHTFLGHQAAVWTVVFSPDQKMIASASADGVIKLWGIDGTLIKTIPAHDGGIWKINFSPDGQFLASASEDKTIKIWSRDGTLLTTIPGHQGTVLTVTFSPDGQFLASASEDKTIKIWHLDGTLVRNLAGHTATVIDVAFSPNSQFLASTSDDQTVKLWRIDGTLVKTLTHDGAIFAVTFSPDSQVIASAGADNVIKIWNTQGSLITTLKGHPVSIWALAFSPDGRILASASDDHTIKLWRLNNPLLKIFKGHQGVVFGVSYSPDGNLIASASGDTTLKIWRRDGTLVRTITGHDSAVTDVDFSPDGQTLVSSSQDSTLKLWQLDGTLVQTFRGHQGTIWGVSFSPDGQRIASASVDGTIKIWGIDGTLLHTLKGHTARFETVKFSPDGHLLASAGDNYLNIWNVDGKLLQTIKGHKARVMSVNFSPDGQILASGSEDNIISLWRVVDGSLIDSWQGHTSGIRDIEFSPDGQMIASSSWDKTIKIWTLNGDLIRSLERHTGGVWSAEFSPDGQTLVSVGEDNNLIRWDLAEILRVNLLSYSCAWLKDYLKTNAYLSENEHDLCDPDHFR